MKKYRIRILAVSLAVVFAMNGLLPVFAETAGSERPEEALLQMELL